MNYHATGKFTAILILSDYISFICPLPITFLYQQLFKMRITWQIYFTSCPKCIFYV